MYGRLVGSEITVIVHTNGRIDEEFTRYWSVSGEDGEFQRQFMAALQSAQFEVGMQGDAPTRYGFRLAVVTRLRSDTIPQKLVWRYERGIDRDSLIGEWHETEAEPFHTAAQANDALRLVTKTLQYMQVLLPTQRYCVLAENDAAREAVVQELNANADIHPIFYRPPRTPCETDVSQRRYRIERPIRTGGGRTVVRASGDLLRNWPPGLDGRTWLAWEAYCVVPEAGPLVGRPQCNVGPIYSEDTGMTAWGPPMFTDTSSNAPLSIAVEVTTRGAYWTDTISASVTNVPAFEERAAMIYDVNLCGSRETWSVHADSVTGREWIAWMKLSGNPVIARSMRIDRVGKRTSNQGFDGCVASPSNVSIAAFLLGTLGDPPVGPVELCHNVTGCSQRISIEAAKHVLAARPALSFKFNELRPEAMVGEQYHLRLHTNRDVEGLVPFIVLRNGDNARAFALRRQSGRRYDFEVTHTPPLSKETVVDVYLARTGRHAVKVPR